MLAARFSSHVVTRFARDGWGATTSTNFTIRGFIQPVSGSENFSHLNLGQTVSARLYCPIETNLNYGDTIGDYRVMYSFQPNGISGTEHHKEVLLSQVVAV